MRTSALVALAVSPFVAYVLLLPQDKPTPIPLEPSPVSSPEASPTPLFSPSPFLALEPEPTEPPPDVASGQVSRPRTTTKPRPRTVSRVAPQAPSPAPAPAPAPPSEEEPASDSEPDDNSPAEQQGGFDDDGLEPGGDVSCVEFPVPGCR